MLDYIFAFIGGLLISIASSLNLLLKGRITGCSGVFWSTVSFQDGFYRWKLPFLSAMIFTSCVCLYFSSGDSRYFLFNGPKEFTLDLNLIGYGLGGLLVGIGTKLGNGCTSGHGICGLPLFSKRSWVAVPTFFIVSIATAMAVPHIKFLIPTDKDQWTIDSDLFFEVTFIVATTVFFLILIRCLYLFSKGNPEFSDILVGIITAIIFTLGLVISGMVKREKIINFLRFGNNFDPSLLIVFMTGVGFNMISFPYIMSLQGPLLNNKYELSAKSDIDWLLVFGAALFGIGWGLTGICPGPGIANFVIGAPAISLIYIPAVIVGQVLANVFEKCL